MSGPLFAESYQDGFVKFWSGIFARGDNVVMFAVLFGILCITLIVASGKWRK